jgi:hypothetical protein
MGWTWDDEEVHRLCIYRAGHVMVMKGEGGVLIIQWWEISGLSVCTRE